MLSREEVKRTTALSSLPVATVIGQLHNIDGLLHDSLGFSMLAELHIH
jgi:hypothetical protein